jgi:hypothetical protein
MALVTMYEVIPKYSGVVPPSIHQLMYCEAPVPTGQTVNSGLRENVRRRHPELEQTWLLHHENAPSHTSVLTQQFLVKY